MKQDRRLNIVWALLLLLPSITTRPTPTPSPVGAWTFLDELYTGDTGSLGIAWPFPYYDAETDKLAVMWRTYYPETTWWAAEWQRPGWVITNIPSPPPEDDPVGWGVYDQKRKQVILYSYRYMQPG